MTNSLDNILSGREAVSETSTEVVEKDVTQTATEGEGQTGQETEGQSDEGGQQGQRMVPHEALHAEKQKVKRYTEQVASFEQTLKERDAANERRFQQMLERLAPKQEQPQPVDFFTDPDAALNQRLGSVVDPLNSKMSNLETQLMRISAVSEHGVEKVKAFETYIQQAMDRNDPEMQLLSAQMRASSDPMATGLKWFEQRTFDPAAERERLKAEILAEIQKEQPEQPAQQQQRPAAVMPTNLAGARNVGSRTGPAWAGPTALNDIFNRKIPSQ